MLLQASTLSRLRGMFAHAGGATALAVAVALLYVFLACPYIVENDTAEFATLGAVGGVAHPSGYPAYVLWLRAWSWLPVDSPAHASALATALLGVAQVVVLHAAARRWGASPLAATLATGLFAVAPLIVRYNTCAEAFALNNLVAACVLWLAAAHGPLRGGRRAIALGLIAGLGLANHMTCALMAPVGLLGIARAAREGAGWRTVPLTIGSFAIGLLPYVYLLVAPDNLMSWQNPHSIADVLDIVLRRAYGGPFGFSSLGQDVRWSDHLVELVRTVGRAWAWGLPVLGIGAIVIRICRPAAAEPRAGWSALLAAILLAGPLLVAGFDMRLDPVGTWTVHRFHLLPMLLLVIPVASGLDLIARAVMARVRHSEALERFAPVMVILVLVAAAATSLPYVQRFHSPAMELEVRNTLRSLPQGAVVLGSVDELDVGIRYLQLARGERPDVAFVRWQSVTSDWYRAKLARAGLVLTVGPGEIRAQVAAQVHALGRPLFASHNGGVADIAGYARYPYGVLFRILPPGQGRPSIEEVVAINRDLFAGFDLDYRFPGPYDEWATWMHYNYESLWRRLGDALRRTGRPEDAASAIELAEQFAPRIRP